MLRFVNRKATIFTLSKKKYIRTYKFTSLGLPETTNLFISENLCPSYRNIFDTAYKMLKNNNIKRLWTYKGIVHLIVDDTDDKIQMFTHIDDLIIAFQGVL